VKAEEIVNEILNNPELLQKIADKVYERLREDVIIKRLESIEDEIKKLYEQQTKILEKLDEHSRKLDQHTDKLDEHTKILEDHKRGISSLQSEVQGLRQGLEDNKRGISALQNEIQGINQKLEDNKRELKNINDTLQDHTKMLQDHTQRLENMQKSIDKLQTQVGTYTFRSGHRMERTMMEPYKEALKLHGVDPDKVKHGYIIDEKGVIDQKGDKYEVDFYEVTDNEVYLFEVKTLGDRGAVEQLIIRKKIFESQGKKVTKMFLVCNVIDRKTKKLAEQKNITVIAGSVV